jgi:hypothetical protein
MAKHPYDSQCTCNRCEREQQRRFQQSLSNPRPDVRPLRKARRQSTRRPTWGTAEWAETHGDDIPSYGD